MKNALDSSYAGGDAFLAKFAGDGKLLFSTYIGGSGADEIFAIAVGPDNDVFLAGDTYSSDFGTPDAWQKKLSGSTDGFIARLSAAGDQLYWLSYIGARPGATRALGVTVDGSGSPYIVGYTSAKNFPTTEHAVQPNFTGGFRDAFLLKLTPDGSAAQYLTYIGGSFSGQSDPDEPPPASSSIPRPRLRRRRYRLHRPQFHASRPGRLQRSAGWLGRPARHRSG